MVVTKNYSEFYLAFLVGLVIVGSALLPVEGRPVKDGSRALNQLRDSSVFNGRSVMSSFKPVKSYGQDFAWLATVKKSGPSPGIGHHQVKGYEKIERVKDAGPSPGVGH